MGLYDYHWVDVFTDRPYGGNPLTVFPTAQGLEERQMLLLARELSNSETVFIFPATNPEADVRLRFFSPTGEMPLAGHAVLGAHFVLALLGHVTLTEPVTQVKQEVGEEVLPVEVMVKEGEVTSVIMTAAHPRFSQPFSDKSLVEAALGVPEERIGPGDLLPQVVDLGLPYLVVPVEDMRAIQEVVPDRELMAQLKGRVGTDRVYLFTMETEESATVHGRHATTGDPRVREDPVSGSGVAAVGAFLVRNEVLLAAPQVDLVVEQGHEIGRPGKAQVRVISHEGKVKEVKVGGPVVHVGSGRFEI